MAQLQDLGKVFDLLTESGTLGLRVADAGVSMPLGVTEFIGPGMKRARAWGVPILSDFLPGAADHTAAMQDMMTYCRTHGAKACFVDDGTWEMNQKIVLDINDFRFFGGGPGSILQIGAGMPADTALLENVSGSCNQEVAHLQIIGRGMAETDPWGIHGWPNAYRMLVHHVIGSNMGRYGCVDLSQCNRSVVHSSIAVRCYRGFTSSGDAKNYGTTIAQCIAEDCRFGVHIEYGRGVRAVNNYVRMNAGSSGVYGIYNSGCDGAYIAGNEVHCEKAGTSSFGITTGRGTATYTTSTHAIRNKILGNTIRGTYIGMQFQMIEKSIIAHNTFVDVANWGIILGDAAAIGDSNGNQVASNVFYSAGGVNEVRGQNNHIYQNTLADVTGAKVSTLGVGSTARDNPGFVTENSGAATIPSGTTSIAVSHGLAASPGDNISVTPTNNLGAATKFWISGVTNSDFVINVDADPGAGGATFKWEARQYA